MSRIFDHAMAEQEEKEQHKDIARELGITIDELDDLGSYDIEQNTGNDGHPYSWSVIFHEPIPAEVRGKIGSFINDTTVLISLNAFDRPEPDEPD